MFEFDLNSDYGFVRVGRLIFSWLNKVSHYEDGVTSVTLTGGDVEYALQQKYYSSTATELLSN